MGLTSNAYGNLVDKSLENIYLQDEKSMVE